MKLLICLECGDVFNLTKVNKTCSCGNTCGICIDDLDVEIKGNCKAIGFVNSSFTSAYWMQKMDDDTQKETDSCCSGVEFKAFFIPEAAKSVRRIKSTNIF